jgi:hypothetical protein
MSPRNSTTGPGRSPAQDRRHRGGRHPQRHLEPESVQGIQDTALSAGQLQAELRVGVQGAAQTAQFVRQAGGILQVKVMAAGLSGRRPAVPC